MRDMVMLFGRNSSRRSSSLPLSRCVINFAFVGASGERFLNISIGLPVNESAVVFLLNCLRTQRGSRINCVICYFQFL